MAQVAVTINGRSYTVTCENGKEDHVARLADYLNGKVVELIKGLGQAGDTRLLVLAGLQLADELSDSLLELNALRGNGPVAGDQAVLSSRIETAASRIEAIVARLERP
jgi:cell division protein ZapA